MAASDADLLLAHAEEIRLATVRINQLALKTEEKDAEIARLREVINLGLHSLPALHEAKGYDKIVEIWLARARAVVGMQDQTKDSTANGSPQGAE